MLLDGSMGIWGQLIRWTWAALLFSTHTKLPYSELLGIWNKKIQQEDHCIVVTYWLLMQNTQAKERGL